MKKILITILVIVILGLGVFSYVKLSKDKNNLQNSDSESIGTEANSLYNQVINSDNSVNKDTSGSKYLDNENSSSKANLSKEESMGGGGTGGEEGNSGEEGDTEGAPAEPISEAEQEDSIINQSQPLENNTFDNSTIPNNNTTQENNSSEINETITPENNQTEENVTEPNNPIDCYVEGEDSNGLTIFSSIICHDSTGSYTNLCVSPINQDTSDVFIKTFICINNRCNPKYYSCPVKGQEYFQDSNYRCISGTCISQ